MNICIVLYNTEKLFDIPNPVTATVKTVTLNFLETSLKALDKPNINYRIVDTEDLNDIFSLDVVYDKYVVIAYGCIIVNPFSFWNYILEDTTDISGQLLNLAPNLYSIHEQLLLFNDKVYLDLKNNFQFTNEISYKSENFVDVIRSQENIHDDYTPLWIKKNSDNTQLIEKKRYKQIQGCYENFIDFALKKNYRISNFTEIFRNYKIYTYHTFEPSTWLSIFNNTAANDIEIPISQKGFFSIFEKTGHCYAYSTDSLVQFATTNSYDCIITTGAGPLPLYYMNSITEDGTIVICDINSNNLIFYDYVLSLPIESLEKDWDIIVKESPCANMQLLGDRSKSNEIWNETRESVKQNYNKITNSKVKFILGDIISNEEVISIIKESQKPFIWFTNVFYYYETINKLYNKKSFEEYIQKLYYNNKNIEWLGKYPSLKGLAYSKAFGKVEETYYKSITIPKIDLSIFLEEINKLEENKLFVDHRSDQSHIGWEAFTLHGTAYDNTTTENGPLDWTPEALDFCPNIVAYFKNNNIRDRYNRLRIMKLKPNSLINIHNDDIRNEPPYKKEMWGMNICITNPTECKMEFWDHYFRYLGEVPWKPGDCNKIRIDFNHMVVNNSNKNRYHIIAHGKGGLDDQCL